MHLSLHIPVYSEVLEMVSSVYTYVPVYSEVLEMVCLTNYFKSVSTEERIAASFRPFNSKATVYSYQKRDMLNTVYPVTF